MATWTGTLPVFAAGQKLTATQLNTVTDAVHGLTDAETAYTPTIKQNATAWTLGNASVDVTYRQSGKSVFVSGRIIRGSTTTSGAGVGQLVLTAPTTMRRTGQSIYLGTANLVDVSAATGYACLVYPDSVASQVVFQVISTAAQASGTSPFVWANGDEFRFQFMYEAA